MATWLLKTEPSTYSFADLVRDGSITWDGVANPGALKNIRAIRKGDTLLIYHTGNEKSVVGFATATSDGYEGKDGAVVDLKPGKPLASPVSLAQVKADASLATWDLVRQSRLSVVAVSASQWKAVEAMSKLAAPAPKKSPAKSKAK